MKEMKAVYHPITFDYKPVFEYFNCQPKPYQETPERALRILQTLKECNFVNIITNSSNEVLPVVQSIHSQDYVSFLERISNESKEWVKENDTPYYLTYPSVRPYTTRGKACNDIAKRGQYSFDTYTPILPNTYEVALMIAGVSVYGAMLLQAEQSLVYVLTRPPGHHAERSMFGGYSYFNNSAVAAEYLIKNGSKKVAILDIDLHHGNGTQNIFYDRSDVLVVNINADPKYSFPHYTGYSNEHGEGEGEGSNYNFPMPQGIGNSEYDQTLRKAIKILQQYKPEYLILSAGFDTHKNDPLGKFNLTTEYYQEMGRKIGDMNIPILVVQEGGYATEVLGANVLSLLSGINCRL